MIKHLVVVGTGLIGSSVALALKKAGYVDRITGVGRNVSHLDRALELGVVDAVSRNAGEAVQDADMVVIAVHMNAYAALFSTISGHLPKQAIVTDVGSTKLNVVKDAELHLKETARFVPAHPIAGTERSGVEAGFADLFQGHFCVLTPMEDSSDDAVTGVRAMWEACGCRVECMGAAEHDDFLAAVSHLPHLVAYALVNAVSKLGNDRHDPFRFAAGGFRDFTRIASSSPTMWRDICLSNRQALLHKMDALEAEFEILRQALMTGDGDRIMEEFERAKRDRDAWLKKREQGL